MDQPRASKLAKEGFDLWQAGHLEAAVLKYVEALPLGDPSHYGLPSYHGEFATVLSALGRDDEALVQFERALEEEVKQDSEGEHAGVEVATFFLAEHLLKMGRFIDTLRTIESALAVPRRTECLMRVVEARALWSLQRRREARASAERAIAVAPSKEKAADLFDQLADILNAPAG